MSHVASRVTRPIHDDLTVLIHVIDYADNVSTVRFQADALADGEGDGPVGVDKQCILIAPLPQPLAERAEQLNSELVPVDGDALEVKGGGPIRR